MGTKTAAGEVDLARFEPLCAQPALPDLLYTQNAALLQLSKTYGGDAALVRSRRAGADKQVCAPRLASDAPTKLRSDAARSSQLAEAAPPVDETEEKILDANPKKRKAKEAAESKKKAKEEELVRSKRGAEDKARHTNLTCLQAALPNLNPELVELFNEASKQAFDEKVRVALSHKKSSLDAAATHDRTHSRV